MNVVKIWSGLGNQMFQYAFGRILERYVGEPTFYDLSWFSHDSNRAYGIGAFSGEVAEIGGAEARAMTRDNWLLRTMGRRPKLQVIEESPVNIYAPDLLKTRNGYLVGYFQVARYYADYRNSLLDTYVLRDVPPPALDLGREMQGSNSVSVHVRRGDYLRHRDVFCDCGADYYSRAVKYIRDRVGPLHLYVFSDDIGWCKDNLRLDGEVQFVDPLDAARSEIDMYLMSQCRHNIIANSSYSWWGAWLNRNEDKIVVAPKAWYVSRHTDIVPKEWCRL